MHSEFWACFKCGVFLRGSNDEIVKHSKEHQSLCVKKSTERENINQIIKGLQEFSAVLPPPPPPPIPNLLQAKEPWFKQANILTESAIQKENIAPNDPRRKMPVCVVNELKSFFGDGKKLKHVPQHPAKSVQKPEHSELQQVFSKKSKPPVKPQKRLRAEKLAKTRAKKSK